MPTIMVLRHAKSDWDDPSLDDHDRPLAARGRAAAMAMGRYMAREGLSPAVVLCSTAARAQQTVLLVLNELGWSRSVRLSRRYYLAETDVLLDALRGLDPTVTAAMMVAHDPGMAGLAAMLAGSGPADHLAAMQAKFPTAALAVLRAEGTWRDLAPGQARLERFVRPRDLYAV